MPARHPQPARRNAPAAVSASRTRASHHAPDPRPHNPQALSAMLAADPVLRERLASWTLAQACRDAGGWAASGAAVRRHGPRRPRARAAGNDRPI